MDQPVDEKKLRNAGFLYYSSSLEFLTILVLKLYILLIV